MKLQNEPNGWRTRLAPESQSCSSAIPINLQNEPKPLRPTAIAPKVPTSEAAMPEKSKNEPNATPQTPSRRRILQNEPKNHSRLRLMPLSQELGVFPLCKASFEKTKPPTPTLASEALIRRRNASRLRARPQAKICKNEPTRFQQPALPPEKARQIDPRPKHGRRRYIQNEPTGQSATLGFHRLRSLQPEGQSAWARNSDLQNEPTSPLPLRRCQFSTKRSQRLHRPLARTSHYLPLSRVERRAHGPPAHSRCWHSLSYYNLVSVLPEDL